MHVSPLVSRIKLCLQASLPQKFSLPSPPQLYNTSIYDGRIQKNPRGAALEDANTLRGKDDCR